LEPDLRLGGELADAGTGDERGLLVAGAAAAEGAEGRARRPPLVDLDPLRVDEAPPTESCTPSPF
jgi:hypothetical protein